MDLTANSSDKSFTSFFNLFISHAKKSRDGSILPRDLKTFLVEPGISILVISSGMAIGPLITRMVDKVVHDIILPVLAMILSFFGLSKYGIFKKFISQKKKSLIFENLAFEFFVFIITVYVVFVGSGIIKNNEGLWGFLSGNNKLVKNAQKK
jgi:large-conductance mechanosensitive channel